MQILKAEFVSSSPGLKSCPDNDLPEFAFIGRSNVGKSSLVNMLTGRKHLAKVSQSPGKTRLINHFNINDQWMLVDLPGYGYARISKTEKEKIDRMIEEYLTKRESLRFVFLLVDSRHELMTIDKGFMSWLAGYHILFSIILTKCDKLSRNQLSKNISSFKKILDTRYPASSVIPTSSTLKQGKDEILDFIEKMVEGKS